MRISAELNPCEHMFAGCYSSLVSQRKKGFSWIINRYLVRVSTVPVTRLRGAGRNGGAGAPPLPSPADSRVPLGEPSDADTPAGCVETWGGCEWCACAQAQATVVKSRFARADKQINVPWPGRRTGRLSHVWQETSKSSDFRLLFLFRRAFFHGYNNIEAIFLPLFQKKLRACCWAAATSSLTSPN